MLAIVLSRRDIREFDQLIVFYTREKGKIEVLARGIKKILSKNSPHLWPGNLVEAEIISGKENFTLAGVEPVESWNARRKNLRNQLFLKWSLDFFSAFTPVHESDARKFDLLFRWLKFLNKELAVNLEMSDQFASRLLAICGFAQSAKLDHKSLHKFAVYHLEKKLPDWQNIAKIS